MTLHDDRVRKLGVAWHQLRTLARRGVAGTLELDCMGSVRRLQLQAGAIRIAPEHPLARHLEDGSPAGVAKVAQHLARSLLDRPAQSARFTPDPAIGGGPAAGSVPVGKLFRCASVLAETTPDWLEILVPDPERELSAALHLPSAGEVGGWDPEELWLLERLRHRMSARRLVEGAPVPIGRLRRALAGLLLADHIGVAGAPDQRTRSGDLGRLSHKLAERIAVSLEESPLTLSEEEYRRRIADLLASAGALDHYELLDVRPGIDASELAHAFEELARLAHPSNVARFGLGDRRPAVSFLFERACEAYRTLSDPDRRIAYHRSQQIEVQVESVSGEERQREAERLARQNFERARTEEAHGDLQSALLLLEQVVRTAPTSEYWVALARIQRRNPAWLGRAIDSYRSALELDPRSGEIRFELGGLHEQMGDLERARAFYQSAAASSPPNADAKAALVRLGGGGEESTGLLGKIFGRS